MREVYSYEKHGRIPDHLRAAVLLAGGTIDQRTMVSIPDKPGGLGLIPVSDVVADRATIGRTWVSPVGLIEDTTDGGWMMYGDPTQATSYYGFRLLMSAEAAVIRLLQVTSST